MQKAAAGLKCEVFVVDNNSTDGSEAYFAGKFPAVHFKWNNSNQGFGKASNSVLSKATGEHILFLNPDTIIPEDCFTKCLAFFNKHANCGALGVRMVDGSGKYLPESKRGLPSPSASFFKILGLSNIFPSSKIFAQYYAGHLPQAKSNKVEVLAGAFMMLSRKALLATGGFDEDFFMYGEDIDLSYRVRKAGMSNYYFADTSIIHFKGESTQKLSGNYIEHFYGAMGLFARKHYGENKKLLYLVSLAIKVTRAFSLIKTAGTTQTPQAKPTPQTAIVAGQQKFNECVAILKHAAPPVLLIGRIAINLKELQPAIGELNILSQIIRTHKINQVVFCEADLSYKEIISHFEKNATKASFLIHSNGSNSMVGSNNKNSRGLFIAGS